MAVVRVVFSYVAFWLAWPLLSRHRKLQGRKPERFGRYKRRSLGAQSTPCVWLHGASAGDIAALAPTVQALRRARPDGRLVVSALTDSGIETAERLLAGVAQVIALPWDLPHVVARALDAIGPDVLVLEYAELWPNLLSAARARHVAVVLHNGRLTPSFARRYRLLFFWSGNLLKHMALLLMRDANEAAQAIALGAVASRVVVAGNTKLDHCRQGPSPAAIDSLRTTFAVGEADAIWVAGSTHEGEEAHVFAAQAQLCQQLIRPPVLLVAPRYTLRAATLVTLARRFALPVARHSERAPGPLQPGSVVVLDELGILFAAYALAQVVFVGGSFVPRGGQNMLEPASLGVPVCYGPSTHNFAEATSWLVGNGGTPLKTAGELAPCIGRYLADTELAQRDGARARAAVWRHTGAAEHNAQAISSLWPQAPAA